MDKFIYSLNEASELDKNELGGKGRSLIDLASLGLPVPPGFIITTKAGLLFSKNDFNISSEFLREIDNHIRILCENASELLGREVGYGDEHNPLLVSVRSGAPVSMPGQMSTILNVGLSKVYLENNSFSSDFTAKLIWGLYRSIAVARGIDRTHLKQMEAKILGSKSTPSAKALDQFQDAISKESSGDFREVVKDPRKQLIEAIKLVWKSWDTPLNQEYRRSLGILENTWTAVVVQMMVYGNKEGNSGSGVVYSRDLFSGKKVKPLTGSFLFNSQGEAIVSGESIGDSNLSALEKKDKKIYKQLATYLEALEDYYQTPLDIEITVDDGKLWFLQARPAPISDRGLVQFVIDQTGKNRIFNEREAVERISPSVMERLNLPTFSDASKKEAISKNRVLSEGIPASPGAGIGLIAITQERAEELAVKGEDFIWVKDALDPKEHQIMRKSAGIISMGSSVGSHGAIMANVLKKPCIVCCEQLTEVNIEDKYIVANGEKISESDRLVISVDAVDGYVFSGKLDKVAPQPFPAFNKFLKLWDKHDGTKDNKGVISPADGRPHSPWGNATDPGKYQIVDGFRQQIIGLLNGKKWNTEKAQVVEAMKIVPESMRINQIVIDAEEKDELKSALLEVISEKDTEGNPKYWNGPRTALGPGAEGSAPWQMGMKTEEQIYAFLSDRDFKGVDKAKSGGYPRWINPDPSDPWTTSPAQIIVMYDPAEKGVEEVEHEHFVCNISCRSNPDEVTVDINLGTAQLRSFETIKPDQLIRLTMELREENPHFVGRRILLFGKSYWNLEAISSYDEFSKLSTSDIEEKIEEMMLHGELSEDLYTELVGHRNIRVARFIESIVFGKWWTDYQLPYRMRALDEVYSLQVLELQGRADKKGEINWFLVYDAKGRDEKKTIEEN